MKKSLVYGIFLIFLLVFFSDFVFSAGSFCGGTGTKEDPYLICTWHDLRNITKFNASYKLENNLDKNTLGYYDYNSGPYGWEPIKLAGKDGEELNFYGNNKTISDLFIQRGTLSGTEGNYIGLFSQISIHKCFFRIFDLGLLNVNISGKKYVGAFIGYTLQGLFISNSYVTGSISGSSISVGGFVGDSRWGKGVISNSYFIGNVSGFSSSVGGLGGKFESLDISNSYFIGNVYGEGGNTGGLSGFFSGGNISNSYFIGNVYGEGSNTGGLSGYFSEGNIFSSYAIGNISSTSSHLGGLVGLSGMSGNVSILNSYAIADLLSSSSSVGGLVGTTYGTNLFNSYFLGMLKETISIGGLVGTFSPISSDDSYWDKEYSGVTKMCGSGTSCDNSFGKTTSEMKSLSTFSNWNISYGEEDLNFGYPYLASQVGRNDFVWLIPRAPACVSLGGYCSPANIENSEKIDGSCLDSFSCYSCNEGYKFDSNFNCVNEGTSCVSGFGYSYWNKSLNEKEWTYNSDSEFSGEISSCNKYSGFCCPENFVCEENGKCVISPNYLEICSSLKSQDICNSNPEGYAKNEFDLFSQVNDIFGNDPCNSTWFYNESLDKNQRSICFCSWEENVCKANRSMEYSQSPTKGSGGDSEVSFGDSSSITTTTSENCENGFMNTLFSSSNNNEETQISLPCIDELPLPFFGIFGFIFAIIILLFVYLFFYSKKFKKLFSFKK